MSETENIEPIDHPDIVIADTGPLISLARAKSLHLLHEIGADVVIVDVISLEATRHLDKPQAAEIRKWIDEGLRPGANKPIRLERTTVGTLLETALKADPTIKAKDAGENAIADWLAQKVDSTFQKTIVIYENGKVGRLVEARGIDADIDVITTRAFLNLAERRGLIPSAQEVWSRITDEAPTTNPRIAGSFNRRPPAKAINTTLLTAGRIEALFDASSKTVQSFARAILLNEMRETGTRQTTEALISLVPLRDRQFAEQAAMLGERFRKDDLTVELTQLAAALVKGAAPLPATSELLGSLRRNGASAEYLTGLEAEMNRTGIER